METGTRPPLPFQPGGPTDSHLPPAKPTAPVSLWSAFDSLQLVRPGRVLLMDVGCEAASRLLMSLLAGSVAQGRDAVVVDGGNWLDAYRLGDAARAHALRRETVLQSVRIARGFTAYQLQSLVEDALPPMLREPNHGIGLVLASCLPEMYLDEDLHANEARVLVERALRTLRELAREHDVPVLVSNMTLAPQQTHRLRRTLDAGVDDAVALLGAPHGMRILTRGRPLAVLATDPRTRQQRLAEFEVEDDVPTGVFYRRAIDARIRYAPKHAGEMRFRQREQGQETMQVAFSTPGGAA